MQHVTSICLLAAVLALCQTGAAVAQSDSIEARVQGQLRKAPAGTEHAGFEVTAGSITWEVDASSNPELAQHAAQLDGQALIVTGTYAERGGASRARGVLTAKTMEAVSGEQAGRGYIEVTVRGTIRTGIMAIGGETTGATITAGPVTWELQLEEAHHQIAGSLSGQRAAVTGRLTHIRGVEIRSRFVIRVQKIGAA